MYISHKPWTPTLANMSYFHFCSKKIWNSPIITHLLEYQTYHLKLSNRRDSRAALQTQVVATSRLEHVAVHLERLPPYVLPKINHLHTSHSVEGFGGIFVYKNLLFFVTLLRYRVVVRGEGKAVKILHAFRFCVEKSGFFPFTNHMGCVSA